MTTEHLPQVGSIATIRNRRAVVTAIEEFDSSVDGRLHLVSLEYTDPDGVPQDRLLWEREPSARVMPPSALPLIDKDPPMAAEDFDAIIRAARWSAITPYLDPDDNGPLERLPASSPFHGAIQVEDFQLVPLLKALRMPRISLLIADDVGLGKTVEAGLILSELLIRRRVRRVLILSPASIRSQWRQEMDEKFSLPFEEVDRDTTHDLKKRLGLDANPWRTFQRIVTSYHYFKQANVLEDFRSASRIDASSPHLPWDLLIVDEAHNLSPSPFGEDSDLAHMLAEIVPYFEHRLFLTATPHNGHTRSFSGLLEMLDPVRFSRRSEELSDSEKSRVQDVLVRRLKREINAATDPPLFCEREIKALPLKLSPEEVRLSQAVEEFRSQVKSKVASLGRGEELAGSFAVEILRKRLLSCPTSLADSWQRYMEGARSKDTVDTDDVRAAERSARQETADDREAESLTRVAAEAVGSWLKPLAAQLKGAMHEIEQALKALGLHDVDAAVDVDPKKDTRFSTLSDWIETYLRKGNKWRDDDRVVIFTEYKTTLDYLRRRLRKKYGDDGSIRVLYGGMDGSDGEGSFDEIRDDFNDPDNPVRVLVATDAASEGINLQETARYLIHWDVPWNPARLEQRNGRIDRHGQPRDVTIFHFASDNDADLDFLGKIVVKVDQIREDLGSVSEVFDEAFERRFLRGEDAKKVEADLDVRAEKARKRADYKRDLTPRATTETGASELERLRALQRELDLSPDTLRRTLERAMNQKFTKGDDGRFRLQLPIDAMWQPVVDESIRMSGRQRGAIRSLVFDPDCFLVQVGKRKVFRPRREEALLHLGHPMLRRAIATFARNRLTKATRWTVRHGTVPNGVDSVILLSVEELAVNKLRETFHHWIHTFEFHVRRGRLGDPLPHRPASELHATGALARNEFDAARNLWFDVEDDIRLFIQSRAKSLTKELASLLESERASETQREQERYQSRQGELSKLIESNTIQRLEKEIAGLDTELQQGILFDQENRLRELRQSKAAKEEELSRRKHHYEELRRQLATDRERVVNRIIPNRFAMHAAAQVIPVAVEIRFPKEGRS